MTSKRNNAQIGVFDSGKGGLTVVKSLIKELPSEKIVYYGDSRHFPWGDKPEELLIERINTIVDFLVNKENVKAIIPACNTASIRQQEIYNQINKRRRTKIPVVGVIEPIVEIVVQETEKFAKKTLDETLRKYLGSGLSENYQDSIYSLLSREKFPITKSLDLLREALTVGICLMATHRTIKSKVYDEKIYHVFSQKEVKEDTNNQYLRLINAVIDSIKTRIKELKDTNAQEDVQKLESFLKDIYKKPDDAGYVGPKIYDVKSPTLNGWGEACWYVNIKELKDKNAIQQVEGQIKYDLDDAKVPLAAIDIFVPACTHLAYFEEPLQETLRKLTGRDIGMIRPGKQVAKTLRSILEKQEILSDRKSQPIPLFYTNYDEERWNVLGRSYLRNDFRDVKNMNI